MEIKIAKIWKTGTYTTPVVIGPLRVIMKGVKKCVDNITGTVSIGYLQIINLFGAAHIVRSVLSIRGTPWQPKLKVWTQCIRGKASNSRTTNNSDDDDNNINSNNNNNNNNLT